MQHRRLPVRYACRENNKAISDELISLRGQSLSLKNSERYLWRKKTVADDLTFTKLF